MIGILRRLRRTLLQRGLYANYLKYALGEIILVVAGILIALQLNNWNESQKAREDERIQLQSLREELQASLEELEKDYQEHLGYLEATLNVYEYILEKPPLEETMYRDFSAAVSFNYFFPKTSIYETLKSGNFQLLRSEAVKTAITDVYENGYKRILTKVDTRRNASRILFPYYQQHFRTQMPFERETFGWKDLHARVGVPVDYDYVINDPEFETLIVEAIHGRTMNGYDFERTIDYIENCLALIDAYLAAYAIRKD
jgi:hypothetical protein